MQDTMRSEDFTTETAVLFAATASRRTPNVMHTRDQSNANRLTEEEEPEELDADEAEFAWQGLGEG